MQVIFVHHSCFVVEVDEKVLIFDWFGGERVEGYHFGGVLPVYEPDTPVYVFASHKHQSVWRAIILAACSRSMSRTPRSMCLPVISIRITLIWTYCIWQSGTKRSGLFCQRTVK